MNEGEPEIGYAKKCDIWTWKKKHLFLDISSTNIHTLVPSLYQCVEIRSTEVFWLLSQPLPHLRFNLFVSAKILQRLSTQLWTLRDKHFPPQTGNISLWISFVLSSFTHINRTTERCSSVAQARSTVAILTTETSPWTYACASATLRYT
jgi:hypothetical protein